MIGILVTLGLIVGQLSLLAFGGGNTILPELQRQVVDVQHWMSGQEFAALFALAQAAPGPNLMVITLIGWHVAGWQGALVASVAGFGPPSLLAVVAVRLWDRFKEKAWRRTVAAGLLPITVGLVAASAALIAQEATMHNWVLMAITAFSAVLLIATRLHPLWVLAGGALVGLSGIGLN